MHANFIRNKKKLMYFSCPAFVKIGKDKKQWAGGRWVEVKLVLWMAYKNI
jgi:hypothetical protein